MVVDFWCLVNLLVLTVSSSQLGAVPCASFVSLILSVLDDLVL